MRTATVAIRDRQWQVWVAASPYELARGLSGIHHMPSRTGMLLIFQPQPVTVNTQQLRFPIDIVFISNQLRVVSVARNVPPGVLVTEQSPVQYVLEINATETAGIEAGEPVGIAIHQSPMSIPEGFVPQLLTIGIVSAFIGGVFRGKHNPPAKVKYIKVTSPGDTVFREGDIVGLEALMKENLRVEEAGGKGAVGEIHQSPWLTPEQREELVREFGHAAVAWAEAVTVPRDMKGVRRAAEHWKERLREVLGM